MKNIHLIQTDEKSRLLLEVATKNLFIVSTYFQDDLMKHQNLFITSDEEIKEGDWFLTKTNDIIICGNKNNFTPIGKKIILPTELNLIKDGVQEIDNEFLEWFLKNQNCEWVNVETNTIINYAFPRSVYYKYKVIFPLKEHKHSVVLSESGDEIFFDEKGRLIKKELRSKLFNVIDMIEKDDKLLESSMQGTTEKAAEIFFDSNIFCDGITDFEKEISIKCFNAGAKWYEEKSNLRLKHTEALLANCEKTLEKRIEEDKNRYSEEDIKQAYLDGCRIKLTNPYHLDKWFAQFKKK